MITVDAALEKLLALAAPLETDRCLEVPLRAAAGRTAIVRAHWRREAEITRKHAP